MSKPNAKQVADALRCSAFGGGVPCCECYFLRIEDGHKVCSSGGIEEDAAGLIEEMGKEIQHLRRKAKDLADLMTRKTTPTNAPTVDAVRGLWVWDDTTCTWSCSHCQEHPTPKMGYIQSEDRLFRYCPHCGARMDGGDL